MCSPVDHEDARNRNAPFSLDEEEGVRHALLFLAVKPLRQTTRIEQISDAISSMAADEAYYLVQPLCGRSEQQALAESAQSPSGE